VCVDRLILMLQVGGQCIEDVRELTHEAVLLLGRTWHNTQYGGASNRL